MPNLAIIVTGQIRTFFDNDSFSNMISLSKTYYINIIVICILNSNIPSDYKDIELYFNKLDIQHVIINYTQYRDVYNLELNRKFNDSRYLFFKDTYFSSGKDAHRGLSDPDNYCKTSSCIQQHQVKIGIECLNKYSINNSINFDIIMKTRFDSKYPYDFCPHIPSDTTMINTLSFNQHNKDILINSMKQYGIKDIDGLIDFNTRTRLILPKGHIDHSHRGLSFGGMVCYNYKSLINIKEEGIENILYSFNDYYYFAKKKTFFKLFNWFDDSSLFECANPDLYNHYFCPESQLIIFCLNNNINILMYPECFYDSMINR